MQFQRYAVFYSPPDGPLADFGSRWLGWDIRTGQTPPPLDLSGLPLPLSQITQTPRRYGLHATLKPPFRLITGQTETDLQNAFSALAASLAPVVIERMELAVLGRFLALVPHDTGQAVARMAAQCVRDLDTYRAPPNADELAQREGPHLSARQRRNLAAWGYPYVMEDFRFHITLTGKLPKPVLADTRAVVLPALQPVLSAPLVIDSLILAGECDRGFFHQITRAELRN